MKHVPGGTPILRGWPYAYRPRHSARRRWFLIAPDERDKERKQLLLRWIAPGIDRNGSLAPLPR